MGPELEILKHRPDLKTSLLLILATALVLLVVMHPITAELTGRAGDRRNLEQARKELARAQTEIRKLRDKQESMDEWARDEISANTRFIIEVHSDIKDIRRMFQSVEWIRNWIQASNSKRR